MRPAETQRWMPLPLAIAVLALAAPSFAQDSLAPAGTNAAAVVKDFKADQSERAVTASKAGDLREIALRCPAKARRAFLASLALVNGEVASSQISAVESCLGADGLSRLPSSFGLLPHALYNNKKCQSNECEEHKGANCTKNCGKLPCQNNCGGIASVSATSETQLSVSGYVSLAELLSGCSEDVSNRFLDSLVFLAGKPVAADVGLLDSCAKAARKR